MPAIIQMAGNIGVWMHLDSICTAAKGNLYCICSYGSWNGCSDDTHGKDCRAGGKKVKDEGKKVVLTVLGKLAAAEADAEEKKPPFCIGFLYQPKRPKKKR